MVHKPEIQDMTSANPACEAVTQQPAIRLISPSHLLLPAALLGAFVMAATPGRADAAPAHKSAVPTTDTSLGSGRLQPKPADDASADDKAPPPPPGYETVQDMDTVLEAHAVHVTTASGTGLPPDSATQTPRSINDGATQFDIFGVPVKIDAPVVPPYNGSFTYTTYGGQPGTGRNAPGAWGAAGEP